MENLLISLNVISPVFIMMALGYFLKRIKMIDSHSLDVMNNISFKLLFPLLLFDSIYKTDIKGAFSPKLILFALGTVMLIFVFLCIVIPLIEKDNKKRGVLIQGIFRSNFVIFGLPISIALCGEGNIGPTSVLIAIIVPIYNAFSIVALEMFRGEKINVKKIILGVLKNPFVISAAVGVLCLLINLRLPSAIDKTISDIAKISTPLALILLGASFNFSSVKGNMKQILIGVIGKLVVMPLIFIPIYVLAGFRGVELAALVVMIGAPTAVSTYTMATKMDGDDVLAGQLVVFDSIGSVATMFLWVFILKQMGMF